MSTYDKNGGIEPLKRPRPLISFARLSLRHISLPLFILQILVGLLWNQRHNGRRQYKRSLDPQYKTLKALLGSYQPGFFSFSISTRVLVIVVLL